MFQQLRKNGPTGAAAFGQVSSRCAGWPLWSRYFPMSLLSDHDLYLFNEGSHTRLYERLGAHPAVVDGTEGTNFAVWAPDRSEEHTSELQSRVDIVCRLLLEKKNRCES